MSRSHVVNLSLMKECIREISMKIRHKTNRIYLTGLILLLLSVPAVQAQASQSENENAVLSTTSPDALLSTMSESESGTLITLLSDEKVDTLLQALIKEQGSLPTQMDTFLSKVESFKTGDSLVSFQYIDVPSRKSLLKLALSTKDASNYPVVVLKKDIFVPGVEIVRTLDLQILNYQHRDEQWQILDEIHKAKYDQLDKIVGLQGQRVEAYKSANEQLNLQIKQLNEQLTSSVELTERSLKGRQLRNLWIGALGGVFGFSVGVLISAL